MAEKRASDSSSERPLKIAKISKQVRKNVCISLLTFVTREYCFNEEDGYYLDSNQPIESPSSLSTSTPIDNLYRYILINHKFLSEYFNNYEKEDKYQDHCLYIKINPRYICTIEGPKFANFRISSLKRMLVFLKIGHIKKIKVCIRKSFSMHHRIRHISELTTWIKICKAIGGNKNLKNIHLDLNYLHPGYKFNMDRCVFDLLPDKVTHVDFTYSLYVNMFRLKQNVMEKVSLYTDFESERLMDSGGLFHLKTKHIEFKRQESVDFSRFSNCGTLKPNKCIEKFTISVYFEWRYDRFEFGEMIKLHTDEESQVWFDEYLMKCRKSFLCLQNVNPQMKFAFQTDNSMWNMYQPFEIICQLLEKISSRINKFIDMAFEIGSQIESLIFYLDGYIDENLWPENYIDQLIELLTNFPADQQTEIAYQDGPVLAGFFGSCQRVDHALERVYSYSGVTIKFQLELTVKEEDRLKLEKEMLAEDMRRKEEEQNENSGEDEIDE